MARMNKCAKFYWLIPWTDHADGACWCRQMVTPFILCKQWWSLKHWQK